MLVQFTTKYYPTITTFGDVATALLKLMGQSGQIPGAILAEDVPEALENLQRAVSANPDMPLNPSQQADSQESHDQRESIDLSHRAMPLIELLQNAIENNERVVWEQ